MKGAIQKKIMTVRMSEVNYHKLTLVACQENKHIAECIREAIDLYFQQKEV
jgi:predicted DNA-binding protein